jgi:ubiquinone/menaquinone biosynthesis C-methylase UbiE
MSSNNIQNDWNRREVDFSKVHGDDSRAFQSLIRNLKLRPNVNIADIMSGYGAVSQQVLEECKRKGIKINLTLSDSSETQIKKSKQTLNIYENKGYNINRILSDVRIPHLSKESLDIAIIKMGLHEVPKQDQPRVLRNLVDSLKSRAELYVWESFGNTEEVNEYFNMIVRQKDRLAGYSEMVKNRYFPTREQIVEKMKDAGLRNIKQIYEGEFEYPTYRLSVDFKGDKTKLDQWNQYIKILLPPNVRKKVKFKDYGDWIDLKFTKGIFVGRKI